MKGGGVDEDGAAEEARRRRRGAIAGDYLSGSWPAPRRSLRRGPLWKTSIAIPVLRIRLEWYVGVSPLLAPRCCTRCVELEYSYRRKAGKRLEGAEWPLFWWGSPFLMVRGFFSKFPPSSLTKASDTTRIPNPSRISGFVRTRHPSSLFRPPHRLSPHRVVQMVDSGTRKRHFLACHAALPILPRSWQLSVV